MAYVRGHYRRDGSYVRPHYRRTRSAAPSTARPVTYTHSVGTTSSTRAQSVPANATTHVRGHYRNGRYVRPHRRHVSRPAAVVAGGGASVGLLILLVLAVLTGGGTDPKGTPGRQSTAPASSHLSR